MPTGDDSPARYIAELILEDEHRHIYDEDLGIDVLMATSGVIKGGKQVLGAVHLPTVQGKLKSLFEMLLMHYFGRMPDFLMIIDEAWWEQASDRDREALIWHELSHIKQETDKFGEPKFDRDGNPTFGLVEHDVAAFKSEVSRYGAWSPDLQEFFAAAGK
jgi:hypothetical protein